MALTQTISKNIKRLGRKFPKSMQNKYKLMVERALHGILPLSLSPPFVSFVNSDFLFQQSSLRCLQRLGITHTLQTRKGHTHTHTKLYSSRTAIFPQLPQGPWRAWTLHTFDTQPYWCANTAEGQSFFIICLQITHNKGSRNQYWKEGNLF